MATPIGLSPDPHAPIPTPKSLRPNPHFMDIYYLIRSRQTGQYLFASQGADRYLLLFREDFEARSYLTHHGGERSSEFVTEAQSLSQARGLLARWSFAGLGMVRDPQPPLIEFLGRA